ncbi:MAG: helix-turn-helix domain-containing protein [Polyangiales bacterium]
MCSVERRRAEGWLSLEQAAALIKVSPKTLRRAAERNDVRAHHPLPNGPWIFVRTDLETEAAKRVTKRVCARRERTGAGPTPDQLSLIVSNT